MNANGQKSAQLSIGQCATLACLLEATAPKPGNVHRGADFEDLTFTDFAVSAAAVAPAIESAATRGVGAAALGAIMATRQLVAANTNLGMVLLIAPLAAVPREIALKAGIVAVLQDLSAEDAQQVYQAIRLAQPGGLGKVEEMDVAGDAPESLLAAMRAAADRDLVARQYVCSFADVFQAADWLAESAESGLPLTANVVYTYMRLLSRTPDSLIARKCGREIAQQVSARAAQVLDAGRPGDHAYQRGLADFDFYLRSDGHRRNPGTTADLIAAALFAALRDGRIEPPFR